MRHFLSVLLLCLVTLTVSAQIISEDSASVFPNNRARLVSRASKGFVYLQSRSGGSVVNRKLWLNGVKSINNSVPDALGNVSLPAAASKVSDLPNDIGYITASTAPVQTVAGRTGAITLSKADVNLSLVDNTSDLNKPLSNAATTALSGKQATLPTGSTAQYLRGDLSLAILNAGTVGLALVDNTSDANKPLSNAATTALSGKEPTLPTGTATQYIKANKTIGTLNAGAVLGGTVTKTIGVTNLAHGATVNHALTSTYGLAAGTKFIVWFQPTGSNQYDPSYDYTITDDNNLTITTPFDGSGARETFTGNIIIQSSL